MGYPTSSKIYEDTGVNTTTDVIVDLNGKELSALNYTKFSMTIVTANASSFTGNAQMISSNDNSNWDTIGASSALPGSGSGSNTISGDIDEAFIGIRISRTLGSADFTIYLTLK